MSNNALNTEILDKAIVFAVKAHANTERRGKGFPYIVHPMEAVEIVATMTADQELLAAAALHDTVEDTDITLDEIRAEFGERVAKLVEEESDKFMDAVSEAESWHARKQAAIDRLADASRDAKMVALGDKLSNARAIYRDYVQKGDELWKIFHVTDKAEHEWHYRGLVCALSDLAGTFAYSEFSMLVGKIFGDPKAEIINMDDYEQTGDGYTAISYTHKNKRTMIKLYHDFVPQAESLKELLVAWKLVDMGLEIPKAYRLVTDGKRFGVEFELIRNKKSFARAISNEPETLKRYAVEFAQECKKLHSTPCDMNLFRPTSERFIAALEKTKLVRDEDKPKIQKFIESVPWKTTCIHGDLHIGNIITTGEKNYWIDLSAFGYGNPLFDLGMFYFVCHCASEEMTNRLFHVNNAQMHEIWKIFVSEYFGPQAKLAEVDEKIKPFAALMMVFYSAWGQTHELMEPLLHETILK